MLFGQSAELSGFVRDPSGATVMDASLELRNQDTGIRQHANANTEGFYSFAGLKPGAYQATVQANKFRTLTRQAIVLEVAERASLTFTLQLALVTQSITVNSQAALLNSVDPAVSTVVDQQFVQNTPLNGRSFQSLIALTPGVVFVSPRGTDTGGTDLGQFSVNGQRANANYFMVDGVSANFGTSAVAGIGQSLAGEIPGLNAEGATSGLVSVDAMQEFRVQTSSYTAEYGHTPGAQISILTRSGTNRFHGTAFDYLRNDLFDAKNFFDVPPLPKPPLRQNDFGGTLGGPIRKNKTFFFFSYEGLRLRLPQTITGTFYTAAARENVAPVFKPLLAALPIPDGPVNPDGVTANLTVAYSDPSNLNATSLRIDHNFNSRVTLFGRYNHAPSTSDNRYFSELDEITVNSDTLTVGLTILVTPSKLNEFRANWSRQTGDQSYHMDAFHGAVPPPASDLYPPGYSTSDNFVLVTGGLGEIGNGNLTANVQRQWNFVDAFSISARRHELKFGFDFRQLSPTSGLFNSLEVAAFYYSSLQSGIAYGVLASTGAKISAKLDNYSSFAQDTWRVSPRLTLTYGLRWEINTPPVSTTPGKPLYAVTGIFDSQPFGLAPAGTALWRTRLTNFAPRIGAAWQFTPKTVLRGGFGLYYDLGVGGGVADTMAGFPYERSNDFSSQPFNLHDPAYAPPPFSLVLGPNTSGIYAFDPHLRVPVTYEWNVTIDRALGANQRLSASYVGSYGRNLLREDYILQPPTTFPYVAATVNGDWSHYSALQVQFQRRMSHGLQALVSYALARSVDTNSDDICLCTFSNSLKNVNVGADLGSSDFDVRNSLAAAVSYQVPGPRARFVSALLRNWTVDGIVRSSSALPYNVNTVVFGVPGSYFTQPDVVPGIPFYIPAPGEPGGRMLNSAAFSTPGYGQQGNLPRNYFRGFPINQTDVALSRRIHLTEHSVLQVRAEFFNVFNHPMFSPPASDLGGGLFGQVYQTLNNGLGGLNPLYQIGGPRSGQFTLKLLF